MFIAELNEENLPAVLSKLGMCSSGKNFKRISGEVDSIDSLNGKHTNTTDLENVFLYKKYDAGTRENFIDTLNNDEEEFCIYLGDKVFINSKTKFSVVHKLEQDGEGPIYTRDDISIIDPRH